MTHPFFNYGLKEFEEISFSYAKRILNGIGIDGQGFDCLMPQLSNRRVDAGSSLIQTNEIRRIDACH